MKITSASKKVLASALSAAMVVAFAPTVAFGVTTDTIPTKDCDDAAMAALGYVAKVFQPTGSAGTGYKYYTAADMAGAAANYILIKDIEVVNSAGTIQFATGTTVDMAGHTIKATNDNVNAIKADGTLTMKNGTVEASGKSAIAIVDGNSGAAAIDLTDVNVTGKAAALDGDNNVTIKNGTYSAIAATGTVTVKGTVETKAIAGNVVMTKSAALTVVAENADEHMAGDGDGCTAGSVKSNDATGIGAGLTMDEGATVTVTANAKAGAAYAIKGTVANAKKATINATAKANAVGQDATAIAGQVTSNQEGAVLNATAISSGTAYGIDGGSADVTVKAGTVSAEGASNTDSVAVKTTGKAILSGGTYTGFVDASTATKNITGGKYSEDPTKYVDTANNYDVSKTSDGLYTVQMYKGFTVNGSGEVADYVTAAIQQMVKGETPTGIKLADGVTPEDVIAQAQTTAGIKVVTKYTNYVEKSATAEQKAAVEAIKAAMGDSLAKLNAQEQFKTVSITLQYDKSGQVAPVVLGTVTALGQIPSGMSTKQAVLEFIPSSNGYTVLPGEFGYAYVDGKATKVEWKKGVDGKVITSPYTMQFTTVPTVITVAQNDMEAIKDAAEKGEQASETITDPAVMAAIVQLQDQNAVLKVEGKSKTVKKGKSATIKLGVPASKSGAKVTFKKANTAGKKNITVSKAGTVTVKKALKKGTYKVKVKATCGESFKNVYVKIVKK